MKSFASLVEEQQLGETYLFSVGQAGYIIKSKSGKLFGIDLYLSDCVERDEGHVGFKRLLPKILAPEELTLDVLVATHPHLDHFDYDSMAGFMKNGKTKLFASINCQKYVQELQIQEDNVTYVKPGDTAEAGDFTIDFVKCDHGNLAPDAVGIVVTVDHKKLYFAGDTCLRLDWVDEIKEKGPFDIMIAAINGAYGNLNEEDCFKLSEAIKPQFTIPCHYGMFASHGGSVQKFIDFMGKTHPFYIMTQGEVLKI